MAHDDRGHDHGGHDHGGGKDAGRGRGHRHHGHHHHHHGDRALGWAVAVNLALTVVQVAGGLVAGSIALLADAMHNLSDALALLLAWAARRVARRRATPAMSFGYGRAEAVAALVNYTALVLVAFYLAAEGLVRLLDPPAVEGWIVVWVAGVALVIDALTAALTWRLARESANVRAAFLHNVADALGSVVVIVAGVLIILWDWRLIDPLATLAIAGYILWMVAGEVRPVVRLLMLGAPDDPGPAAVAATLGAVAGVASVHHLHLWQIDEGRLAVQAHLALADGADQPGVLRAARAALVRHHAIGHATLEPEPFGAPCAEGAA
ncbi:MAG: cation transporter [Rhodobacteraceae bacterium]|nr:cation transporter [Paracoccaceae bacterium]